MSTLPLIQPGAPPDPPERPEGAPPARPRWPAWTSVAALVTGLVGALIGGALVGILASLAGASISDPPPAVDIAATVIQDACLIGAALLFARMSGKPSAAQFGLRPTAIKRAVGMVAGGYVAFLVFSDIWVQVLDISSKEDLPDKLGANSSAAALVAVMVLVAVIAPIAEEFFFRGYFFTALRGRLGTWGAAIATGVFFGGIHAGSSPIGFLVPLGFFGFVLCLVYWRSGSLYPCIALHALNNGIAFGSSEGWDWQIPLLVLGSWAVIAAVLAPVARRSWARRPAAAL